MANLISLMDSPSLKVQCQAALALRNLASDGEFSRLVLFPSGREETRKTEKLTPDVSLV